MGDGLEGVKVGVLESRQTGAVAALVRRYGGVAHCAAALREARTDCAALVSAFLDDLEDGPERLIVFMTASGATALVQESDQLGRLPQLLRSLGRNRVVCRGPKPVAVMSRYHVVPALQVAEPYTSVELLAALDRDDLRDAHVTLVHYGERADALSDALTARGARLHELCLYEWRLPDDLRPLQNMIRDTIDRQIDALMFTSQVQCRHLFQVASDMNLATPLRAALNSGVVVAVIGPVCRAALEEAGVVPHVEPEHPKMAALVLSLARHFALRTARGS
jgi:uroporphyrinogen-III synthase